MADYLHFPWVVIIALAGIGAVVIYVANQRLDRRMHGIGFAFLLVAIALGALRFLLVTNIERVEAETDQLVRSCVAQDWPTMQSLMDSNVAIAVAGSATGRSIGGRDLILGIAKAACQNNGIKSARITSIHSTQAGGLITVDLHVLAVAAAADDRPVPSEWELEWKPVGAEWKLDHITLLNVAGRAGDEFGIIPH